ncbi:hypothetical protein BC831DRAFT_450433 [Entophlyctis helioformis]|nr:hypothetical protein BC831DRAFT_450433 [Entophlyctis helioformis]
MGPLCLACSRNVAGEYLSAAEAEHLVRGLQKYDLPDLGSAKWESQHELVERLNIQVRVDEYVTQALLLEDKIDVLVHNLLVTDLWKRFVYPHLETHLAAHNNIKAYFLLYSEASILNLLEVALFDRQACGQIGVDLLAEFVEYLSRKMVFLCTSDPTADHKTGSAQDYLAANDTEQLKQNTAGLDHSIAISGLAALRYITDVADTLDITIIDALIVAKDTITTLVALIERAPWLRRTSSGSFQMFDNNRWETVKEEDMGVLGKAEAQVWLSLYNLMMEPECRKKYTYTKHNQAIVLRLQDYITEVLVDQLPVLTEIQRYLHELSIMDVPETTQVATFRGIQPVSSSALSATQDWKQIAETQMQQVFTNSASDRQKSIERLARMYDFDGLESLVEPPKCSKCGKPATQRCSRCQSEWYCSRPCQVKSWQAHKSVCEILEVSNRPTEQRVH